MSRFHRYSHVFGGGNKKINDIQFGSLWTIVFLVNMLGFVLLSLLGIGIAILGHPENISFNGKPATEVGEVVLGTSIGLLVMTIMTAIGSLFSALLFRVLRFILPKLELRVDTSNSARNAFE